MKILLASPRGFCAGVIMAIDCLEQVLDRMGPPVYVFHEIVHNRHVVERFSGRGAVFVNAIQEIPEGSTVVYSAHGVSPEVRREARQRRLVEVDATCPLVSKVHGEAVRFAAKGYRIILIGHRSHDEVVGTLGEAPRSIHVVESVEDVQRLDLPQDAPLAYLTQTTLSLDDARAIVAALQRKYPDIQGPRKEDICYATTNRQEAVSDLAGECDLVLVVGSQNSSNTLRLAEIARNRGVAAHVIDDVSQLREEWLAGAQTVLVTAGASAPEDLVRELVRAITKKYGATVEHRLVRQEDMHFALPASLQRCQPA